jgi:hypothetical protein
MLKVCHSQQTNHLTPGKERRVSITLGSMLAAEETKI